MALVFADNVKETSTTQGTGTLSLAGAVTGFEGFVARIGNGNTCYYTIRHGTIAVETGLGTVTDASPDTLSRDTVYQSTNGDALVDLQPGKKTVFIGPISSRVLQRIADGSLDMETKDIINVGNLGIGVAVPLAPLHIEEDSSPVIRTVKAGVAVTGGFITTYEFYGQDDAGGQDRYSMLTVVQQVTTSGNETGKLVYHNMTRGVSAAVFQLAGKNMILGQADAGSGDPDIHLVLSQTTPGTSPANNSAWLRCVDVAGTGEIEAEDEAGNVSQVTPHPGDILDMLDQKTLAAGLPLHPYPHAISYRNKFLGKRHYVDMANLVRFAEWAAMQLGYDITQFDYIEDLPSDEKLNWGTIQAGNVAQRRAEVDDWKALPPKQRSETPRPKPLIPKSMPTWMVRRISA